MEQLRHQIKPLSLAHGRFRNRSRLSGCSACLHAAADDKLSQSNYSAEGKHREKQLSVQIWQDDPDTYWPVFKHNAILHHTAITLQWPVAALTLAKQSCPRLAPTVGDGEQPRSLQFNSYSPQHGGNCSLNCTRDFYEKNPLGLVPNQAGDQV